MRVKSVTVKAIRTRALTVETVIQITGYRIHQRARTEFRPGSSFLFFVATGRFTRKKEKVGESSVTSNEIYKCAIWCEIDQG